MIRKNINKKEFRMSRSKFMHFQLEKVYTNINEWIYLKEQALIKSYHIDISIKQINLTLSRDFKIEESYEVIKEDNKIMIYLYDKLSINKESLMNLNQKMNLTGCIVSDSYLFNKNHTPINDKYIEFDKLINNIETYKVDTAFNYLGLVLESNFDEEITTKYDTLYHVTKKEYVDNILKIGLVPYSDSKLSIHPDRVYLAFDKDILIDTTRKFQESDISKYKDKVLKIKDISYSNVGYKPSFTYTLLQIKIDPNIKLYNDPNYSNGCFSLDNIKPDSISIIQDIIYET